MRFRPRFADENRESFGASACASWHRRAVAMGTAILFALYPVAPAWAGPAGAAEELTRPAGGRPGVYTAVV